MSSGNRMIYKLKMLAVYLTGIVTTLLLTLMFMSSKTQAAETYNFVTKWGSLGEGDGQFRFPNAIAVDVSGNIYVADDYNCRIQKFSSAGLLIGKWSTGGSNDPSFCDSPKDIAVDNLGNVYVMPYSFEPIIYKFSANGKLLNKFSINSDNDAFADAITTDRLGYVYVLDSDMRVQKFNPRGTLIEIWSTGKWNNDEEFGDFGESIAVDISGNVYIVNSGISSILKFSPKHAFITKWGNAGIGDGQFEFPKGLAVDGLGYLYAVDLDNPRVQKFSSNGVFITKWGSLGEGDGQFNKPIDVAIDTTGNVYVLDSENNRIQKFAPYTPNGTPSPPPKGPPVGDDKCAKPKQNQKSLNKKLKALTKKLRKAKSMRSKPRKAKRLRKYKKTQRKLKKQRKQLKLKLKKAGCAK